MKNKPNYGNWIPRTMLLSMSAFSAVLFLLWLLVRFLFRIRILSTAAMALFLFGTAMTIYMYICSRAFSFEGGCVMGQIHLFVVSRLNWDGKGRLLDIGCGSGALSICCAKAFPAAEITGLDYWGKEWNYAKEQCEANVQAEQVQPITFLKGDAASLPFEDETFDAAVSNFVFHEVRSQPDKRQVVREALRVIKPGGAFAFHDLFEQKSIYGDMNTFILELQKEGIREIHYEPHTERLPFIPWYVKAPWLLNGLGIIYGRK
ncbi:MAG: class I SAM-dependent methyltransferase [Eubacteriales bacterium]|nr:class I SAM-dependent methyltransferase [Eubacteriales bacterium]